MKCFQIAMVDDLAQDRNWLASMLQEYMNKGQLLYELSTFSSGEDFLKTLSVRRYDIVFMDVYMDGITGVETANRMRAIDRDCKLVFTTTTEEFMREGFALNSAHYLIKPVQQADFQRAMENCYIQRELEVPRLTVVSGRQTIEVDTVGIFYINVTRRNVTLHTATGDLLAGRNFSEVVEPLLADRRFLMCNKAILVNMDHIVGVDSDCFRLTNGERLPLALRRKQELMAQYRNYVFGNMGGIQ